MAKLYKLHTGSPHQRLQGLLCLLRLRQPWSQVGGMAAMAGECTRELPASHVVVEVCWDSVPFSVQRRGRRAGPHGL